MKIGTMEFDRPVMLAPMAGVTDLPYRLNLKSNYLKSTRKEKYSLQPSASLTVESAFVFPFFFLAIVILVLFLDLYRIQSVIQESLSQSSRELGMYAYCESDDEASPVGAVSSARTVPGFIRSR